ncbi:protein-serine/threonine phosphatase [Ranunculus cassubicifolius]
MNTKCDWMNTFRDPQNNVDPKGPFPGGPKDASVLRTFYGHVALFAWFGEERNLLRLIHHTKKFLTWNVDKSCKRFYKKVEASGLSPLLFSLKDLDLALICAFIERWHPEIR